MFLHFSSSFVWSKTAFLLICARVHLIFLEFFFAKNLTFRRYVDMLLPLKKVMKTKLSRKFQAWVLS